MAKIDTIDRNFQIKTNIDKLKNRLGSFLLTLSTKHLTMEKNGCILSLTLSKKYFEVRLWKLILSHFICLFENNGKI